MQRSEGGALGIGGGSGNILSGRGAGNVLTRSTGVLAAVFFATRRNLLLGVATGMTMLVLLSLDL